jgi:hypothetical protein
MKPADAYRRPSNACVSLLDGSASQAHRRVKAADSNDTLADSGMHSLHACVRSTNLRPRLLDASSSEADARIHSLDAYPNRAD